MAESEELVAFHKKRKVVVMASLTKLETPMVEIEVHMKTPILLE